MSFAHPLLAILGVLSVGVPIVLHLLRRRRKPVRWGAMRFVLEAQRKTRQRVTLEQLLLLIARCVLIGLAGLAIARPLLSGSGGLGADRPTVLAIVLDDGITSGLRVGDTTTLDRLKSEAERLLEGIDPSAGDRAMLVLAGSPPRSVFVDPTGDLDAALRRLRAVEPTAAASDVSGAVELAMSSVRGMADGDQDASGRSADRLVLAVLSGFRGADAFGGSIEGNAMRAALEPGDRVVVSRPETEPATNTAVVSVTPTRRVRVVGDPAAQAVRVALKRWDESEPRTAAVTIKASADGVSFQDVASGRVEFARGADEASAVIPFNAAGVALGSGGVDAGELVLRAGIESDALVGDDASAWPIGLRDRLRVLIADETGGRGNELGFVENGGVRGATGGIDSYGSAAWIRLALAPDAASRAGIDVEQVNARSISRGRLSGFDAAIVTAPSAVAEAAWEALAAFVSRGGLLVVVPDASPRPQVWSDALASAIEVPWVVSREPESVDARLSVGDALGPLEPIGAELEALAPAVRVERLLEIETGGVGTEVLGAGGRPFFVVTSGLGGGGQGLVGVFASAMSLAWTDLPAQPLMVPLMQELLREGVAEAGRSLVRTAGEPLRLPTGVAEVRRISGTESSAGKSGVGTTAAVAADDDAVRTDGVYRGVLAGGERGPLLVFNPAPGDTTPSPEETVNAWASGFGVEPGWLTTDGQSGTASEEKRSIARQLLILALIAGLVEVIVAGRLSSPTGALVPWRSLRNALGLDGSTGDAA